MAAEVIFGHTGLELMSRHGHFNAAVVVHAETRYCSHLRSGFVDDLILTGIGYALFILLLFLGFIFLRLAAIFFVGFGICTVTIVAFFVIGLGICTVAFMAIFVVGFDICAVTFVGFFVVLLVFFLVITVT